MTDGFNDFTDPALARLIQGTEGPLRALERLDYWRAATGGYQSQDAALDLALAEDVFALEGSYPAQAIKPYIGPMLARAASRLRAAQTPPRDADIQIERLEHPFHGFFGVERVDYRHRRFDGAQSPSLKREVFVSVDAVTVLPYDPITDHVLVIEQIRPAPILRGDQDPYSYEAIAGRIDAGESPESTAIREAAEEAGLELHQLLSVGGYYPSPGALSEYIYAYLAITDLPGPEGQTALHGLPSEGEDIRSHIWRYETAMAALQAGQIRNAPLALSLLWLSQRRDALRQKAKAAAQPQPGRD